MFDELVATRAFAETGEPYCARTGFTFNFHMKQVGILKTVSKTIVGSSQ